MKRDLELVRKWLLYVEEFGLADNYIQVRPDEEEFEFFGTTNLPALEYNFVQAVEAGLIVTPRSASVTRQPTGDPQFYILRLSPAGHDFLDAVRDKGIWEQTKHVVAETGGSAALEVIKALAVGFGKKQIERLTGFEI